MNEFYPKNLLNKNLVNGIYFKSENDVSSYYLIEICEGKFEGNALVKIYTTDIPDNHFDTHGLSNGCEISFPETEIEFVVEINLCGKYFFPKFNNERQLYYDAKKYYNQNRKTDSITSLFEAINYGIEYGLNKSDIVPY